MIANILPLQLPPKRLPVAAIDHPGNARLAQDRRALPTVAAAGAAQDHGLAGTVEPVNIAAKPVHRSTITAPSRTAFLTSPIPPKISDSQLIV